jgi:hypothetical protein
MHEHVRVAVRDARRPGAEEVPARRVRENEWEILRSPLYATALASGDVIRIVNGATGEFEVIAHGGNVCIQFYLAESAADDAQATRMVAEAIERDVAPLRGSVDAYTPGLIAVTVPANAGFPAIERALAAAADRYPGSQWQYSNVYDPNTGDPLRWWE